MSTSDYVTIYLDHIAHSIAAGRHTGAQIRALRTPPASDLFWDIPDAPDQAVAPDSVITATEGMRFFTSSPVTIYINARPYSVRPGAISEEQLRSLIEPSIGTDHAIWLDIPDANDRRLAHGELIDIAGEERFFSAPERHEITIIVNTRPKKVAHPELTFLRLVELAFDQPPNGENVLFTITYKRAVAPHSKGQLPADGVLTAKEGTIVNVQHSDKS